MDLEVQGAEQGRMANPGRRVCREGVVQVMVNFFVRASSNNAAVWRPLCRSLSQSFARERRIAPLGACITCSSALNADLVLD